VSGSTATNHRLVALGASAIDFLNGSTCHVLSGFQGNFFGAGSGTSALNSVEFETGALYSQVTGFNPFGASASIGSVGTFHQHSRYRLDGAITPSFSGRTYADFAHNAAGPTTTSGALTFSVAAVI